MKKKLMGILLALVTLLCIVTCAYAEGYSNVTNVASGEGQMHQTTDYDNIWANPWQGVRLSVYRVSTGQVLNTLDYSNLTTQQIQNYPFLGKTYNLAFYWFGEHSKLYYRSGNGVSRNLSQYHVYQFLDANGNITPFPNTIIDGSDSVVSGGSAAAAVKRFFADKNIMMTVAKQFGMTFEEITDADIKILLEPVAYFRYMGDFYAMSATEAAVFQKTVDSNLIMELAPLTAEAMPLAMYLETPDIGIPAYGGGGGKYKSAELIIDQMGIGIISFHDIIENPGGGGEGQPRICCDCDENCPCKFTDDGDPIHGECRCFDPHDDYGHPTVIPCDPDYPHNCLCQLQDLVITKVDSKTGEKLSGAVFMITNTTTKQSLTGTTGKDGTLTFKDLHAGYWKIVEIAPPAGYYAEKDYTLVPLLDKDQSVTIGNLKNPPIDPPKGNNIVWGYELNRSFTNDTNFSNLVNWNTLAEPTVNGCSDGGTTRYVASIPSYGTIIKTHSNYFRHSRGHYEDTYDGKGKVTGQKWVVDEVWYTDAYDYTHNNHHTVGYKWDSGDVTVNKASFLGANSLTDNSGMGKYKIMHNGSNYLLKFNTDSNYIVSRLTNLFKELTTKTWISHRNGGLSSKAQEINLAGYMSAQNSAYKSFYKTYTGNTPNESNSYASNGSNYKTINDILTSSTHGGKNLGKVQREFAYKLCNGGTREDQYHPAYTDKSATQSYKYSVEGTYKASANANLNGLSGQTNTKEKNGTISQVFQSPSNIFNFYPTYRMWYTDDLNANDTKVAWMLSAGHRTFQATDAIKVEITGGETDVWAPWSRDWEDKYTEDSEYGNETERDYPVIKSGMVVKAVAQDANISVTAAFHVQDPTYAPADEKAKVIAMNDAKAKEMEAAVNAIVADLTDTENITYGFYSNLWEATSENLVDAYPETDTKIPNTCPWAVSESPKTRLNITGDLKSNTPKVYRITYRGTYSSPVGTMAQMTLNGNKYTSATDYNLQMLKYTDTCETVDSLLDSALGNQNKRDVRTEAHSMTDTGYGNWYEEYYDGIRLAVYKVVITLPSSQLKTDYCQVHSQISDSTTDMNEFAEAYVNRQTGATLIPKGMYGIGLCAMQKEQTTVTFGGKTFQNGIIYWPAKLFGVRGSVYDLAQNAPQYYIKLP